MQPEIVLVPVAPASRTGVSVAELRAELEMAADVWNRALERRRAPRLRVGAEREAALVRQDGVSVIILQSVRWCPTDAREQDDCYDKRRSAITHLYPVDAPGSARDGEISEADIEVNAVDFRWTADRKRADGVSPLRAVLAHELGHVLGLDHPCIDTLQPRPSGPGGAMLRPCSEPASKLSIMYPDPIESGRPAVLMPGADEEATVGELYAVKRACACGVAGGQALPGRPGVESLGGLMLFSFALAWRRGRFGRCA
jgi:hypothetical protein